jgi:peptidoglycan/xylan/chitin deacetylase (PgdA/CDA1 family)
MSFHSPVRRLSVPSSCAKLDLGRVARELKVPSGDLRKLTWSHPKLIELALEEAERLIDRAEERIQEALDGDHPDRALSAATFILSHHRAARERGWQRAGGDSACDYSPPQTIKVCWLGDSHGYPPPLPAAPEKRMRQVSASSSPADRRDADAPDAGRVHCALRARRGAVAGITKRVSPRILRTASLPTCSNRMSTSA